MLSGIIIIDKPAGWTSHDVIAKLRGALKIKRIGHGGTLDPMATGVLPLCIGSATRITEYLDLDDKTYRCEMLLGLETDTQDVWGKPLADNREILKQEQKSGAGFTEESIRDAFSRFHGVIDQIPPKYSAIKVNGRKLYEYARSGETVEIKSRKVLIKSLVVTDINLEEMKVSFDVTCSKGTYIRAICSDVGKMLGCGGAMSSLVRLSSGIFTIDHAYLPDELEKLDAHQLSPLVIPTDAPLVHFGKAVLDHERAGYFKNGGHIRMNEADITAEPVYQNANPPLAIREEYKRAYNMYERESGVDHFLGVAFYDLKYKKLVADKVFLRGKDE